MYRYILAFAIALGGAQFISVPAQAQNAVKCESRKFKYRECDVDMRRPRIVRQLSGSPCIAGDTWGFNRGTIWVDKGCAAVFADSGRGRPRWRDRDRGWDDDGYPPRADDDYYPRRRRSDGVELELDF